MHRRSRISERRCRARRLYPAHLALQWKRGWVLAPAQPDAREFGKEWARDNCEYCVGRHDME